MLGLAGGIFLSNSNENGESTKLMSCFNDTTEGLFWSKEFWLIKINNTRVAITKMEYSHIIESNNLCRGGQVNPNPDGVGAAPCRPRVNSLF